MGSWLCGFYRGVGDAVSALPALKKIKEQNPQVNLVIAGTSVTVRIFEAAGVGDRVIIFERLSLKTLWGGIKLILCLRKYKFDRIFISPHAWRGGWKVSLFSFLVKTRNCSSYGNSYDALSFLYTNKIRIRDTQIALKELNFFEKCKIITGDKEITYPNINFKKIDEKIVSLVSNASHNHISLIGIHPGASMEIRRWHREKVKLLLKHIISSFNDSKVILIRGPAEKKAYDRDFFDEEIFHELAIADTDIISLIYLISKLDRLVCWDSGVAHIAAMFAIPTVALYGPKPPSICGPVNKNAIVLYKDALVCRSISCYKNKCRLNTNVCMEEITIDEVIEAMETILDRNCRR